MNNNDYEFVTCDYELPNKNLKNGGFAEIKMHDYERAIIYQIRCSYLINSLPENNEEELKLVNEINDCYAKFRKDMGEYVVKIRKLFNY